MSKVLTVDVFVTGLNHDAIERLGVMFPNENPFDARMRPVLMEMDVFARLRDIFPDASLGWLVSVRRSMRPLNALLKGKSDARKS